MGKPPYVRKEEFPVSLDVTVAMAGPFRVVFLAFVASFFCLGLYDFLINMEVNKCEMTYMYHNPQYLVSMNVHVVITEETVLQYEPVSGPGMSAANK